MYKQYKDKEGTGRTEFTVEEFKKLQDHYIKQVIRHNHDIVDASHVVIGEYGDPTPPVGLDAPSAPGEVLTWQDHLDMDHNPSFVEGQVLARGWTVPMPVRCVITTPIFDTVGKIPFPTFNMSHWGVNKDMTDEDFRQSISSNRHNPNTYSIYRHYLYVLPSGAVTRVHPSHEPLLTNTRTPSALFAKTPLFIHSSNSDLLRRVKEPNNTPNFRSLNFNPDYAEQRLWSLTEDFTCWMAGYKSIAANGGKEVVLFFNDMFNEFNQVLSLVNYEEKHREYFFRHEKAAGNLTRSDYHQLSDITRLMEAKALDVLDPTAGHGLVRDAIKKQIYPYNMADYSFRVDRDIERVKTTLEESCIDKQGTNFTFYTKGLYKFAGTNSSEFNQDLYIPESFEDGTRQCLIINGEFGTSKRSFKRLHKGRVMLMYAVVDGFVSVPYEIYSAPDVSLRVRTGDNTVVGGSTTNKDVVEVSRMGNPGSSGFPNT